GGTSHYCRWNGTTWVATTDTDNAMKVGPLSNGSGGGVFWERSDTNFSWPQFVIHGFIYIPGGNGAPTVLALPGFYKQINTGSGGSAAYVAVTVANNHWGVTELATGGGLPVIHETNTVVTTDTWHEF